MSEYPLYYSWIDPVFPDDGMCVLIVPREDCEMGDILVSTYMGVTKRYELIEVLAEFDVYGRHGREGYKQDLCVWEAKLVDNG